MAVCVDDDCIQDSLVVSAALCSSEKQGNSQRILLILGTHPLNSTAAIRLYLPLVHIVKAAIGTCTYLYAKAVEQYSR